MFPSSGEGRETHVQLSLLGRANLTSITGPNRVSPSPHLKMEADPVSETFSSCLEFRTMDRDQRACDSQKITS
jgi:hypothetical protein